MLRFVQSFDLTNNPVHRFYHMQRQYGSDADGVPMGKWVAEGRSGGITMGFYDGAASPVQWRLADEFVLLDHYFQSVHGGSFANHYFLITAGVAPPGGDPHHPAGGRPPRTITKDGEGSPPGDPVHKLQPPHPPPRPARGVSSATPYSRTTAGIPHVGDDPAPRAGAGPDGPITRAGEVTPDGYVVNTLDPPYPPQRLPTVMKQPLTQPTIGDRLDAKGVSWRWYAGGWSAGKDAAAAGPMPHPNPFQYVTRVIDTPDGREPIPDAA